MSPAIKIDTPLQKFSDKQAMEGALHHCRCCMWPVEGVVLVN